jgi:hypothetical protein
VSCVQGRLHTGSNTVHPRTAVLHLTGKVCLLSKCRQQSMYMVWTVAVHQCLLWLPVNVSS